MLVLITLTDAPQAETINRLLKKQSRARGKRNALSTAEDRLGPGEVAGEGEEEGKHWHGDAWFEAEAVGFGVG